MNDSLLVEADRARMEAIRRVVEEEWKDKRPLVFFTPHRYEHCAKVEEKLYELLGDEAKVRATLRAEELFLLVASVWLHDIGMIPELFPKDRRVKGDQELMKEWDKHVRETHGERSARYIEMNAARLGLRPDEVRYLKRMCQLHRHRAYRDLAKEDWQTRSGVRLPLLTAYLRLADCLHISDIGGAGDFRMYMALGMDPVARFHWLKSKYAHSVSISPADFKITITVKKPKGLPSKNDWEARMTPLKEALKRMVRDELDCVNSILARGGLSIYLTVECDSVNISMSQDERSELQELLKLITLSDPALTPNASEVGKAALEQIRVFLDIGDATKSAEFLRDYQVNVLGNILAERPCHVFLWKINEMLKASLAGGNAIAAINTIRVKVDQWEQKRQQIADELPRIAYGVLSDCSSILLYGYSNSVVKCLDFLSDEKKKATEVYVCEARTRTHYRHNNRLTYSDGIQYVEALRGIGMTNVHYVTDSCASNLFSRRKVTKVLFGANGIQPTGSVAHALGHLAIADMASNYNVPVFVIADSTKIGFFNPEADKHRGNQWLATDTEWESKLEGSDNYNPREDIVPPDRIAAIITEKGTVLPPSEAARYADNG